MSCTEPPVFTTAEPAAMSTEPLFFAPELLPDFNVTPPPSPRVDDPPLIETLPPAWPPAPAESAILPADPELDSPLLMKISPDAVAAPV